MPDTSLQPSGGLQPLSRTASDPRLPLRLRGRQAECRTLDQLVIDVRAAQSRVLVIRGEAGVGKTALLDYLATKADTSCRVMRAAGVESEMELAFAGLHQLCAPLLDHIERLPEPQRDALGTAFGLIAGNVPDRFLVGLAVISLLSEAAEKQPIVCLVDDAQWLDRVSAQILTFVARRLLAESVAIVFSIRDPGEELFNNLPTMDVGGLSDDDACALLASAIPGRVDEQVRDRFIAETRGNPLALVELPRGLTAAELAGGFALPDARPLSSRIEQSFLRRLQALPTDTQQLLLVAAAEPVGNAALVWRAAERLGLPVDAAVPAQQAGLIEIGARARFLHPLVRSAIYRNASLHQRQETHRALADATDPDSDPDRRAWHRAHATTGPDESIAAELESSAQRAQRRGGIAAAAAFLKRASEVTPDAARRVERILAAARAKLEAGALDSANELIAAAELGPLDELQRARLARLRAKTEYTQHRSNDSPTLLLDAARRLEQLDLDLARETYLEALGAAIFAGRLGSTQVLQQASRAARAAPAAQQPPRPTDLLLDGVATRFTEGYEAAVAPLKRSLLAFREQAACNDVMRWLWLACPVAPEPIAPELWDDETWHDLAVHAVRLARDAGALGSLPVALTYRAGVHVYAGEFATASMLVSEADAINAAIGNAPLRYTSLTLAAWRGDETTALKLIRSNLDDANARGEGRAIGLAGYATALLYNGLGRYQDALAGAQLAREHEDLGFYGWSLVELIEAAARSGARATALETLQVLEQRARAADTNWALGVLARSRALLSSGEEADSNYRAAIDHLAHSRITVELARAHLVYGEWLRRENRRVDAREQLRTAYERFSLMGAEAFAERARRELHATGETPRKRSTETIDVLTAQESQIARLAAQGHTNPEIGSQLFISPRTAEYHLHKVFTKLGIGSRRELRVALKHLERTTASR